MTSHQFQYETLLSQYCDQLEAVKLLRQYRPYFEMIPSLRRPTQSLITIPLPVVKLDLGKEGHSHISLPCDLAFLMCDPEWKIKTGREIFVFIHRPGEDFSDLLDRWRKVEVILGSTYYWLMPWHYQQMMNDKGESHYPLFITLEATPTRIIKGLSGCSLPTIAVTVNLIEEPLANIPQLSDQSDQATIADS